MAPSNPPPSSPDPELEAFKRAVADLEARVSALEQGSASYKPPEPTPREPTESRFGLTIVNRIGAVTLAIGIVFFFKYAADSQWIGAPGRVLIGVIAGLVLIAVAEWLRHGDQIPFAQGLAVCGVLILYVSAYAAFAYYQLFPRPAGFVSMLAASLIAAALALRYGSAALAALGFIGALLTPVLLRAEHDLTEPWFYFLYLLLLSFASELATERLLRRDSRPATLFLIPSNASWSLLSAWILLDTPHPHWFATFAFALAILHAAAALRLDRDTRLYAVLYLTAHGCFLVAALRELEIWATHHSNPLTRLSFLSELDSVFLAIYAVVMIASGVVRKIPVDRLLGLTLIGIVVAKLYLYDIWLLARFYRISAFVALGIILLAASYIYSRLRTRTPLP